MGAARTRDLRGVLHRLQRDAWIGRRSQGFRPETFGQRERGRFRVDPHPPAALLERADAGHQGVGWRDTNVGFKLASHVFRELGPIDEEFRFAACRNDGKGEGDRIVRNVRAANVEEPCDAVGQRQHGAVVTVGRKALLDVGDLLLGWAAGLLHRVQHDGLLRWCGPVLAPDPVDEIAAHRLQLKTVRHDLCFQAPDLARGVQPGIEANDGALGKIGDQPFAELGARNSRKCEDGGIAFLCGLDRIATVHKKGGVLAGDSG